MPCLGFLQLGLKPRSSAFQTCSLLTWGGQKFIPFSICCLFQEQLRRKWKEEWILTSSHLPWVAGGDGCRQGKKRHCDNEQRWGSWGLEVKVLDSSLSLKEEKQIQQVHSLPFNYSPLCPGPTWSYRDAGENVWWVTVTQACLVVCDSLPHGLQPTRFLCPWIFQARILQWVAFPPPGIFLTWGLNSHLLHCRQILYLLSHQGSPKMYDESLLGMKNSGWRVERRFEIN